MSESLVIIRTFGAHDDADDAQVELLSAGIYSLLLAEDESQVPTTPQAGIALAVHARDADIAEAVLVAKPMPQ